MQNVNMNKKQRGVTLIELLLVLVAIAGIAIAAFVIFPSVQLNQRVNAESTQIATIAANVAGTFGTAADYAGLTTEVAIAANALPKGMVSSTTTADSSFGGNVTVGVNTVPEFFDITYTAVPAEACQKLAAGVAANFAAVTVNGAYIKNSAEALNTGTLVELSATGATGYIARCGNTGTVDMVFTNQ